MDRAGDIGLGYSISQQHHAPRHPLYRAVGHRCTEHVAAEASIIDGGGLTNGWAERWGELRSITVDPVDDCTFWYTNEYIPANGSFNWRTRIASFKFASWRHAGLHGGGFACQPERRAGSSTS